MRVTFSAHKSPVGPPGAYPAYFRRDGYLRMDVCLWRYDQAEGQALDKLVHAWTRYLVWPS